MQSSEDSSLLSVLDVDPEASNFLSAYSATFFVSATFFKPSRRALAELMVGSSPFFFTVGSDSDDESEDDDELLELLESESFFASRFLLANANMRVCFNSFGRSGCMILVGKLPKGISCCFMGFWICESGNMTCCGTW